MTEKIALVVGTRPNFMKAVPVYKELQKRKKDSQFIYMVHSGQHYSYELSEIFLQQLDINKNEIEIIKGFPKHQDHNITFSWMIQSLSLWFKEKKINKVIVFGDVDTTLAATIAAHSLQLKIIHIEAGLRSFSSEMKEERNRIIVDHMSDLLFVTEPSAMVNLTRFYLANKAFYYGNTMIDTLVKLQPIFQHKNTYQLFGLEEKNYILFTFHRKENVDTSSILYSIITTLDFISKDMNINVLFPIHPRTKKAIQKFNIDTGTLILVPPQGYLEMMSLVYHCGILFTDSGGLQEEASYLGVPTLTLRNETERPITITKGTNVLLSPIDSCIKKKITTELLKRFGTRKELWKLNELHRCMGMGKSSKPIAKQILKF